MTWLLAPPAIIVVIVAWAGLAAAGVRHSGALLLLAGAPTALGVLGFRARSVVRRRSAALLGLGLGVWAVVAWAWLRPLTVDLPGDLPGAGPRCGSALLPSPRATIDDPSGCFFPVFDQLNAFVYPALGAVVVSVVACCWVVADSRAASSASAHDELVPTQRPDGGKSCRLSAPTT